MITTQSARLIVLQYTQLNPTEWWIHFPAWSHFLAQRNFFEREENGANFNLDKARHLHKAEAKLQVKRLHVLSH